MENLLIKYIKGEVNLKEREKILRWIDEDPSHLQTYYSLRKLYTLSLWGVSRNEFEEDINSSRRLFNIFNRHYIYELVKIAAVLLIGILGTYSYLQNNDINSTVQSVSIPKGQRAEMTLADGTRVWLNSGSKLQFPDHFQGESRRVELDGEGYFIVAKNESVPFIVRTKLCDVKVLGTEFNVKAYDSGDVFETSLLTGSVEVKNRETEKIIRMDPNEIIYHDQGKFKKRLIENKDYFRWKEGLFCFDDETIGEIIGKLELFYDVRIIMKRSDLYNDRFTGKFRINDGIEHALRVLKLRHKFNFYRNQDDKNLITIY